MKLYQYILIGLVALLVILICIILIRAAIFKPKEINFEKRKVEVDKENASKKFGEVLKCKTISYYKNVGTDYEPFKKCVAVLKENYKNVFEKCTFELADDYGLYFKLKGKSSEKPTVLMAHYDVVPAEGKWDFDPFSGEIIDGYILGRGTLDTKSTMCAALEALDELLANNYLPENDLILCFGADEEVYGTTEVNRIEKLEEMKIKPAFVLDEGGAIVDKVFPGVSNDCAVVGVVEKGLLNVELKVKSNGGHSSSPKKKGSVVKLSKAIIKLEKKPMKAKYTNTIKELFNRLGRNATFVMRIIFANMWLFKGLLKKILLLIGGEPAALVRTTFAFTMLEGSEANNVLPAVAKATINIRVAPFNTIDEILAHIKKVVGKDIEVEVVNGFEASIESSFKNEAFETIEKTVLETFGKDVIVSPYIMLGATDSRHFTKICNNVYRFSPMVLSKQDRGTIHGINEKISVDNYHSCIEFYKRLMQKI